MRAFYTDCFVLDLPAGHRFPMAKYARLRQRVVEEGVLRPEDLEIPAAATDEDLLRVHDAGYLKRVKEGSLRREEVRRLGFPWSEGLVERSRRSVGGTLEACRAALEDGCAVNLAGGTHHAFADQAEGFCVFNDAAVAARALQAQDRVKQVLILDCDVHQGNGTASIFANDPSVFTFSLHGRKNFPFRKELSDLDIELEDGTGDETYLALLEEGLDRTLRQLSADLVIYLAGADPFHRDRFGRLSLSQDGLASRDRLVFRHCLERKAPVAVAMAGGYAPEVEEIVGIHLETVRQASNLQKLWSGTGTSGTAVADPRGGPLGAVGSSR